MKKTTILISTIFLMFSFVLAQDIEAEVDVVVDSPRVQLQSMSKLVEKRISKLQFSNEEKQKLMNKINETLQNTDVPKTLLCAELCKSIENEWTKQKSYESCIQNVEQIQNRIREQIRLAKQQVEKLQVQLQNRERNRQAVEVLQSLVEAGVPVEHALSVVQEAMKAKEGDLKTVATTKALKQLEKDRTSLPAELREQVRAEIRTQMQLRQQTGSEVYHRMREDYKQGYRDTGQPVDYKKRK